MHLQARFDDHVRKENLFHRADNLLLAVSGGVDSVALCELCHRSGHTFSIAHANFGLRAEESDADEQFVRSLAGKYHVPIHVKLFETAKYAAEEKLSIQVAARELRYAWFNELLHAGHRWLLTAHHAGDNTETIVMNFFRGTGISGLRGILPKTGDIIRPLLPFTKEEIVAFAKETGLAWREDSSNSSDKYSRNLFRNTILPTIGGVFPGAEHNLLENAQRFREIEELYRQAIDVHKKNLLETKGSEIHIPVLKLKKATPLATIIYEIIRPFHFSAHQAEDVLRLIDAEHGKYVKSATHRIIKNRNWLIIAENDPAGAGFIVIEKDQPETGNGVLSISRRKYDGSISENPLVAHVDARELQFPLILRGWKPGDYFYPLGMTKKKKVSRFLIDRKLSPTQKEKVLVLESDKRICWVAGLRIDNRFRVTASTKDIVELTFNDQLLK